MKLIRFLSEDQKIYCGILDSDNKAYPVSGDIFTSCKMADKPLEAVKLLPPIIPLNILCIGLNYKRHISETNSKIPEFPVLFIKSTNTLCGPGDTIILPKAGPGNVDYEAELAVVIGKRAKNISKEDARDHIFGYTCANDISARDWQLYKQSRQWARGKSFDTFCPIGPHIITADEVDDPCNLSIRCFLNDICMQDSNTDDMIWNVFELVSFLSQSTTLLPGTVILTGTPEGVGFTRKPPVYLKHSDIIRVEIEKVGQITNYVAKEDG